MATDQGCIVPELAYLEVRSWAVHFPSKRREHRITSVPGHSKEIAEKLLQHLRGVKGAETMSKGELKALCEKRKQELRSGKPACGGEQAAAPDVPGEGAQLVGHHGDIEDDSASAVVLSKDPGSTTTTTTTTTAATITTTTATTTTTTTTTTTATTATTAALLMRVSLQGVWNGETQT